VKPKLLAMNALTCVGLSEDIEMPGGKERIPSLWGRLQLRIPEITSVCGPAMGVVSRSGTPGSVKYAHVFKSRTAKIFLKACTL
jgi:hypothetical protein